MVRSQIEVRRSANSFVMHALTCAASSMLKYEGDDASRSFIPVMAWKTTGNFGEARCWVLRYELMISSFPQTCSSPS